MFINFIVSLPAFALLRIIFIPAMVWLATQNQQWHFGLNYLYTAKVTAAELPDTNPYRL